MHKTKKIVLLKIIMLCIITLTLILSTILPQLRIPAYADDDEPTELTSPTDGKTRSIQKEYFMGIFVKKINNGKPVLFFAEGWDNENERSWEDKRKELNFNIAKDADSTVYSLYDRFGGNISFVKYLGEQNISVNVLDKYYTHIAETVGHEWLIFEGIHTAWDLITKDNTTYTNVFYQGRPILKDAANDPRVDLYTLKAPVDIGTGVEVGTANYFLVNAKVITDFCTFFMENTILDFSFGKIKDLLTGKEIQSIAPAINIMFFFFGVALIFFVIRFVIKFVKSGQASLKEFLFNLAGSLISLGIVMTLVYNPAVFIDTSRKILIWAEDEIVNNMFDEEEKLNTSLYPDEIVNSQDDTSLKMTAKMWCCAIFEPWVQGEFNGHHYEELYTTYANVDDDKKWDVPQDAAEAYGDIIVPRGGVRDTTGIKNWAALAYSCQSIYHINAVEDMEVDTHESAKDQWPKATMPYGIDYIYTDDFRWIDASLKVGHIAGNTGGTSKTVYTDPWDSDTYLPYRFRGIEFGWRAIYLSLLMIPLGIIGVRKTLALLLALVNFFILLYRCALNVFFPEKDQYSIIKSFKAMLMPFASYIFYLILLMIGSKIYEISCYSGNFLVEMACLAITIYMCTMKLELIPKFARSVKQWGQKRLDDIQGRRRNSRSIDFAKQYNDYVHGPTSVRKRLASEDHNEEAAEGAQKQKEKLDKEEEAVKEKKRSEYRSGKDDAASTFVDKNGKLQADGNLTKHDYCDAVFTSVQKKIVVASGIPRWQKPQIEEIYKNLCEELRKTSFETEIINQHRADPENKRFDHLVLGIGPNEFAKGTNTGENDYNDAAAKQREREMRQGMVLEKYAREEKQLDDDFKEGLEEMKAKQQRGEVSEDEVNRYKKAGEEELDLKKKALNAKKEKDYKKEGRRGKGWEKGQEYLNLATGGKHLTGKRIPLKVKFYILIGCVGLWLFLWLIAIFVGV